MATQFEGDAQGVLDVLRDLTQLAGELEKEMGPLDGFMQMLASDRDEDDAVVQHAAVLMEQQTKRAALLHQVLGQLTNSISIESTS